MVVIIMVVQNVFQARSSPTNFKVVRNPNQIWELFLRTLTGVIVNNGDYISQMSNVYCIHIFISIQNMSL